MIAEDFGSVRVLGTESIAGTTVEVACARTEPKDRRGRGPWGDMRVSIRWMSRSRLRAAIDAGEVVFAPLALDALTARIAARAGFKAVYVSGGALGYAHAVSEALLTLDELVSATRHIVARSDAAVIADAGVGFGDAVHMTRTITELEATGAAAVEIEDQVAPKRVSHHRGIEHLVSPEDMAAKVEYAVRARHDPDFLIIARTGAVKNESFEEAVRRGNLYREAGADLVMLMPSTDEQWATAPKRIQAPLATIMSLDAKTADAWRTLGWNLVIDPFTAQVVVVDALRSVYDRFIAEGATGTDPVAIRDGYRTLAELAGLEPFYAIEDATTERRVDPRPDRRRWLSRFAHRRQTKSPSDKVSADSKTDER